MVTSAHEGMHRIFQERPEILAPVFGVLGVPLSAKATVDAVTTDVTETRPLERRVDTVLRVGPSDGEDFLLAIEAQSGKVEGKESSWGYYIGYLQAKYGLPVLLLVVCQDAATAKWAVGPFDCGTRAWTALRVYPLVAGPDNLPVITDVRTVAKNLPLAVLSALAHARSSDGDAILEAIGIALQELRETDPATAQYFFDFLEVTLGRPPLERNGRTSCRSSATSPAGGLSVRRPISKARRKAGRQARRKAKRKAKRRRSFSYWRWVASPYRPTCVSASRPAPIWTASTPG